MVYILGQRPVLDVGEPTDDYFLCSLKTGVTTKCSTRYNASSSGQTLEALCGPEHEYDGPDPVSTDYRVIPNWRDIGFGFLNAMSLNTGVMNLNASYPGHWHNFSC